MSNGKHFVIGVDIGGTKVAAGLVNSAGAIMRTTRRPMLTNRGPKEALEPVFEAIGELISEVPKGSVSGIGMSAPGWIDSRRGVLLSAANLPCWKDFPLADAVASRFGLDTRLANDAKVAALAEALWGAGSSYPNVFYVSLGTGIGTGMVLDHRLYHGKTGVAGEGGHMTIDFSGPQCGCGKRGCIEMYASGTAITRRARERLAEHGSANSKMLQIANGNLELVTAETVGDAALTGDPLANAIMHEAAEHLAIWLGNVIDLLEPGIIVIGGGFGELMREYINYIRERLDVWGINPLRQQIPIRSALYGSESGLLGSAALCLPRTQRCMERSNSRNALAYTK
jgi:glucokinase